MRILLDANISYRLVARLESVLPGITHIKFQGFDPTALDHIIWRFARDNDYAVVMTKDVDFVRLLAEYGPPPKVIRLHVMNQPNRVYADFLIKNAAIIEDFLSNDTESLLEFTSLR